MTTKSAQQSVAVLLQNAGNDGTLSPAATQAISIVDLGQQIQNGLGVDVGDVKASEVVLVTLLVDDSSSIRFAGNSDIVREGHNEVLEALDGSKQKAGILAFCRYLNRGLLYPFGTLDKAVRMDTHNYDPNGGTPLYDEVVTTLATVLAKAQSFEDSGVPCRSVTLIVSDGADAGSRRQTPATVKAVVRDMLLTENHIVAAMGIDDGVTDFKQIFMEMGIDPNWILTPKNSKSDIRKAFQMFSQSAVRASQGGAHFSQAAAGGFGN